MLECEETWRDGSLRAATNPQTLFLSPSLPSSRPLVLSTCSAFSSSSLSLFISLFLSFRLSPSLSISLIPIYSFSSFPLPQTLFRRLNQPAEETTRRGGRVEGSRRGRRGRSEKDRREGKRERAVDEHKHGILSDVDVYVNAEYLMGCQKQSL